MLTYREKKYTIPEFTRAGIEKLWAMVCRKAHRYWFYPYLYRSTWHSLLHPASNKVSNKKCFYTAIPSPGAGIGHQLANWNAGLFYSIKFNISYSHSRFSNDKWDNFFGFGEQLPLAEDLVRRQGYKLRRLPFFLWHSDNKMELNQKIIDSYASKKVLLVAERNQYYKAQCGVILQLKHYFNNASARDTEKLGYDNAYFNIAVHVRRTVVIDSKVIHEDEANRKKRWLSDDYYLNIINMLVERGKFSKPTRFYIFSTTELPEFGNFGEGGEVISCHEWDEYTSFLHLIRADLLVTSKSSFSYKAALFSDGFKISPRHFWHDYPDSPEWLLAENDGELNPNALDFT